MIHLKLFEEWDEVSNMDDSSDTDKIDKIIDELKYLLEDEGCEIEYGKNTAWKISLGHLTLIESSAEIIKNIRKTDHYLEFIDRLSEELGKIGMKIRHAKNYGSTKIEMVINRK